MKKYTYELDKQLILNPTENLPYKLTTQNFQNLHGLYVSDKIKDDPAQYKSILAFSGRDEINKEVHRVYDIWKSTLGVENFTMRLLSGLHMHILLFMSLAKRDDSVALLPEIAGGHYATKKILERLGLKVFDLTPDYDGLRIDIAKSAETINKNGIKFLFVDRSEGLVYEDFTELCKNCNCYKIFDASQYLSHIICGAYKSPFDMGFDMVVSTIHKNFPGPQKAIAFSQKDSPQWKQLMNGVSSYVSSLHIETTLMAGNILENFTALKNYSDNMLANTKTLTELFEKNGMPIIKPNETPITQHIWLKSDTRDDAFRFFKDMEKCGLLVNYRLLPYNLGYGIRMGTAAATLTGLTPKLCPELASIISEIYHNGTNNKVMVRAKNFIRKNVVY